MPAHLTPQSLPARLHASRRHGPHASTIATHWSQNRVNYYRIAEEVDSIIIMKKAERVRWLQFTAAVEDLRNPADRRSRNHQCRCVTVDFKDSCY
nr:hypothetical protein Iba_chr02bCG6970 [Ipomoea batatas]